MMFQKLTNSIYVGVTVLTAILNAGQAWVFTTVDASSTNQRRDPFGLGCVLQVDSVHISGVRKIGELGVCKRITSLAFLTILFFILLAPSVRAQVVLTEETTLTISAGTSSGIFSTGNGTFGDALLGSTTQSDVLQFFSNNPTSTAGALAYDYRYYTLSVKAAVSGTYVVGIKQSVVDTLMYVHSQQFNPLNPALGFVGGNDDFGYGYGSTSALPNAFYTPCSSDASLCPATEIDLTAGITYYLTVSHYAENKLDDFVPPIEVFSYGPGSTVINDVTGNIVNDTTAPTFTFNPANGATGVAVGSNITITANEAIRLVSGNTTLTDDNVDAVITLKDTDASGTAIAFDATISGNVITINPTSDLGSLQQVYVSIDGTLLEDIADNQAAAANATFTTADAAAPTFTFNPANGATGVAVGSNITITANEAIRLVSGNTTLTDDNVDAVITLKDTDASGTAIAFDATISGNVITINPTSDLGSLQQVYVSIDGTLLEDIADNQAAAANATFTTADAAAPTFTFNPANGATGVAVGSNITITANEAIRLVSGNTTLTDDNVDAVITLKDTDASGTAIAFDATISGNVITINPTSDLGSLQQVYVSIDGTLLEDIADNQAAAANATFTTADAAAPTFTFNPANGATGVAVGSNITITANEAIRLVSGNTTLTDDNVDAVITLKDTDASGTAIAFDATISGNVITINPTSDLGSLQQVYVSIDGTLLEDIADNQAAAANATFTTADAAAPTFTFNPANGATGVAVGSNITITANEAIRLVSGNTTLTDDNVDAVITLKDTDASGTAIAFDATISGNVITINPTSDLGSLQQVYVSIDGTLLEDIADNQAAAANATFTTADAAAPTFTFNPANGATGVAVGSNITITANEAIRLVSGNTTLTDDNVDAVITLKDTDASGTAIAFDATISGNVITINPTSDLGSLQQVYVSIDGTLLEDIADNQAAAANATFTTADAAAPTFTFNPANGATGVAVGSNITITANEAIRLVSGNTTLTDDNVDAVITLKDTDASGTAIAFDATISGNVITINPTSDLGSLQQVYVSIDGTLLEDIADNQAAAANATFTTADAAAPTFTFNPANGATGVAVGSNITITANEAIRLVSGNTTLTDDNVDAVITLKDTDASGTAIAFDATISGNVITINPTSDLGSLQQVYVSIDGTLLEDIADNQAAAANATFTTAQIIEDLIDQIRDDLTEILNNDMRGAIDGQQAVISQTSKSALARLRAGNETTGFCGNQSAPDTTGGAKTSEQGVDINAAQTTNTYDCVSGTRITQDVSLRVTKTSGASVQYNLGYSLQKERFVSDTEVSGTFLGAYASRSNVSGKADGAIRGVGVNGGVFGAQNLEQGYLFDYYLGGSLGAHTFDLQFPTAGLTIDADGQYNYGALMSGAAIGRETKKGKMVLIPRIGFDAILAKSLSGSVDASQGSLTDSSSIQLDDYRKVRVFVELELTGPLSNKINFAGLEREWTYAITPRVVCDRVWPASSFECGYAMSLSVAGYDNSEGITTSIDLTGEDVRNTRSIRLSASHRKEIMDGEGAFVTALGGTQDGNVSVGQSLNINF